MTTALKVSTKHHGGVSVPVQSLEDVKKGVEGGGEGRGERERERERERETSCWNDHSIRFIHESSSEGRLLADDRRR